ncbi:MAG: hypothetical protein LBR65_07775 [Culturomica sp.]|jgi:hypothetical protein|nr:hypothetical protein [Culturomica sp.]
MQKTTKKMVFLVIMPGHAVCDAIYKIDCIFQKWEREFFAETQQIFVRLPLENDASVLNVRDK